MASEGRADLETRLATAVGDHHAASLNVDEHVRLVADLIERVRDTKKEQECPTK